MSTPRIYWCSVWTRRRIQPHSAFTWWTTGYSVDGSADSVCAWVLAENEQSAERAMRREFDPVNGVRFISERAAITLRDRFQAAAITPLRADTTETT